MAYSIAADHEMWRGLKLLMLIGKVDVIIGWTHTVHLRCAMVEKAGYAAQIIWRSAQCHFREFARYDFFRREI